MIRLNRMLGPPGLAIFYPNQINHLDHSTEIQLTKLKGTTDQSK